ncbi:MAG: hypothetical protein GEU90_19035 [Gemmatimonas sp.]|nr:hypothetical protein [Gemmatimonas sp.]
MADGAANGPREGSNPPTKRFRRSTDPDFQPEDADTGRCGRKGVHVEFQTPRSRVPRVPEEAGKGKAAEAAPDPEAQLSHAQLEIARDHGFSSWRALKAEVDRRSSSTLDAFFAACAAGDVQALTDLLNRDAGLVRDPNRDGTTGLHVAASHPNAVQLLLESGADPNARDVGDKRSRCISQPGVGTSNRCVRCSTRALTCTESATCMRWTL